MAERNVQKNRKRKHFEIDKNRQSPFQNQGPRWSTPTVVSKAPRGINVTEFAESRALEIQNMMMALSNASETSNKRVFQSIPRHMRRRAASHNSKRMPVRLRDAYNREEAKSQEKMKDPKKKRSRRQRRKPSNLLAEYNRRQRKHVWLETHIWHAKRFKMAEQWGYKIPLYPNDKSVRASYRAMATGCIMQDLSYYQCVEVSGKQELIIGAMKHLTNADPGLTMAAKQYLNGSLEGQIILYEYDKYPCNAIGPVTFLWQQLVSVGCTEDNLLENKKVNSANAERITKLWVWSHPACRNDVSREITHACSLEGRTKFIEEKYVEVDAMTTESKEPNIVEDSRNENKIFPESEASEEPFQFVVSVLKDQLVRLRLTGPKSHALLASMLELCEWGITTDGEEQTGHRWWQRYSKDDECQKSLMDQNGLWERMKGIVTPGMVTGGSVIALVVKDPRLGLPLRKSNVDMASEVLYEESTIDEPAFTRCAVGSAVSPIWDISVRDEVKESKLAEKDLNNLRSKMIVPGSKLDLGNDASRIPILVVQRPGTRGDVKAGSITFGCGYDVILPAGWSMAFWIALVYRGARVGGSRELATCSREQAVAHFPCDFPDTRAGRAFNEDLAKTGQEKYAKYPPAKRPNYEKLGVLSPFSGDWARLVGEWSKEVGRLGTEMGKLVSRENGDGKNGFFCNDNEASPQFSSAHEEADSEARDEDATSRDEVVTTREVVQVVAQPDNTELKRTSSKLEVGETKSPTDHTSSDHHATTVNGTLAPTHPPSCTTDNYFVVRSCLTRRRLEQIIQDLQTATSRKGKTKSAFGDHIEFLRTGLASFPRALFPVNLLMLCKGCPLANAVVFIPSSEDLRALAKDNNYGGPIEAVHQTEKGSKEPRSLINVCSRKAIGFVSSGEYSFARGRGSAVGFCAFPGLCELALLSWRGKCRPLVIVRNTTSFQYRFARLRFM